MNAVDIKGLTLAFGQHILFNQFDFAIKQGRWLALLGASGIGKSTLLRAIAGLEQEAILQGNISCIGKIAWLAQQDSLYPWLSVLDNVQLYQHLTHSKNEHSRQKALHLLEQVNMSAHLHKPCYQLSGGQRQRVALARTMMLDADIILLDEPFSGLDAITRYQLQRLTCQLFAEKTLILITHDPQEAICLADEIYILAQQPIQLSPPIYLTGNAPREINQAEYWQLHQQLLEQLMEVQQ